VLRGDGEDQGLESGLVAVAVAVATLTLTLDLAMAGSIPVSIGGLSSLLPPPGIGMRPSIGHGQLSVSILHQVSYAINAGLQALTKFS
jgi:hypothetical protein